MGGKRIGQRAHEPDENRAHAPEGNRGRKKLKLRETDTDTEGMTAKDAARMKAWKRK